MLLCGFAAIVRMKRHGMRLLYPEMLKLGASCDVVCFDKTGTLTGTTVSLSSSAPFCVVASSISCHTSLSEGKTRLLLLDVLHWDATGD